jgi:hypothetical protein
MATLPTANRGPLDPSPSAAAHVAATAASPADSERGPPAEREAQASVPTTAAPVAVDVDEEANMCVICFDGTPEYVFMPCGHGGYCQTCAHKLFVRPPHHCPICRKLLRGVVRVPATTAVGESAAIRPS